MADCAAERPDRRLSLLRLDMKRRAAARDLLARYGLASYARLPSQLSGACANVRH